MLDALELSHVEDFSAILDTKFIIGFDLAETFSFPALSCNLTLKMLVCLLNDLQNIAIGLHQHDDAVEEFS